MVYNTFVIYFPVDWKCVGECDLLSEKLVVTRNKKPVGRVHRYVHKKHSLHYSTNLSNLCLMYLFIHSFLSLCLRLQFNNFFVISIMELLTHLSI